MTIVHRRIIYLLFMAAFFIILPLIILQATGYRFNSKKSVLQKTGIIFLETKPKEADVYLNGKLVKNKTPTRLKNLLPNEYEIKINKEGYTEWQKKVDVYDGQTTFLQYVRLFKNDAVPRLLIEGSIVAMRRNNNKLAMLKEGGSLIIYDLGKDKKVAELEDKIKRFEFVDNGNMILAYGDDVWLIDVLGQEKVNLSQRIKVDFSNLKVDEFNSNFVFYLVDGQLQRLNLLNDEVMNFAYYPLDYYVRGDEYYLLTNDSLNNVLLKRFKLSEGKMPESLLRLAVDDYALKEVNNKFVVVKEGDKLIVWDKFSGKSEIIKGVTYYKWNSSQEELLFGNDWELWSYRPFEEDKYVLFSRTGKDIKEAYWYRPETHIFYVVGNKIKMVENLVSNRVVVDIIEADAVDFAEINKKGDKLYFVGQAGEEEGLFELGILDN